MRTDPLIPSDPVRRPKWESWLQSSTAVLTDLRLGQDGLRAIWTDLGLPDWGRSDSTDRKPGEQGSA